MSAVGVIAEFNPFHNGHAYCLQKARELSGAEYVVVAMSGDYVQRGEPACMDKYFRARAALQNGADLVLELPTALATGSAEYFARAGVSLLHHLGCVDFLVFGSETGNLETLAAQEGWRPTYVRHERQSKANPNDILGAEYLKALEHFHSGITPIALPRIGTGYADGERTALTEHGEICSATYLRRALFSQAKNPEAALVPPGLAQSMRDYLETRRLLDFDSISELLFYKLNELKQNGYSEYFDVYDDLSYKISGCLEQYTTASAFRSLLKSREIAFTHISRSLLHILLDITKKDAELLRGMDWCPVLRVLGFRKESKELLRQIKKTASLPLLSKLADAPGLLSPASMHLLSKDIAAAHLYERLSQKNPSRIQNEYRREMIIL